MEDTLDLIFKWVIRFGLLVVIGIVLWMALRPEPKKRERRGFDVTPPPDDGGK